MKMIKFGGFTITGVTLLSKEEYEAHEKRIKPMPKAWWLRSLGYTSKFAATVDSDGHASHVGNDVNRKDFAVRPVLQIEKLEESMFMVGDHFRIFDYDWTIISDNLAICDTDIGNMCFRNAWAAEDANVYEKSDVKVSLENWYDRVATLYSRLYMREEKNSE